MPVDGRIKLLWASRRGRECALNLCGPALPQSRAKICCSGKAAKPSLRAGGHNSNKDLGKGLEWNDGEHDRWRIGWAQGLRAALLQPQVGIAERRQRRGF
jgi:hypothetical protein